MRSESDEPGSWQEFEEIVRDLLEAHDFRTEFRVVFRDEKGKSEIDVVARRFSITLAIDTKLYSRKRYRVSQLKREAEKHRKRCERYSKLTGVEVVPVVVPYIDDLVYFHDGCFIVPFYKLNDFLLNIHRYLEEFGYL